MVLSVKSLSTNTFGSYPRQDQKQQNNRIYIKGGVKPDLSCNKVFNISEAMKNFGEGLVSPITSMFSSKKNFLIGAGSILGSTAIIVATGGAAAPILVAVGAGFGCIQAGKAIVKIANAKNGDETEKAFYDIGGATSTLGLSLFGAKPALKQANIETEGLNAINGLKTCAKSIGKLTSECSQVIKSGYFKTNIANALKFIKEPTILRKYSKELSREGAINFEDSLNVLRDILPDKFKPLLKGRSKCALSIYEKMVKERTSVIDGKIQKVLNDNSLSVESKTKNIKALREERIKIKKDGNFAKSKIEDLRGARLTLNKISKSDMELLVNALGDATKKGEIEILEIENYRGFNPKYKTQNQYYLSEAQVEQLKEISGNTTVRNATKPSGYTAVQLKVKPKGGQVFELQIRGKHVDAFADVEHIPYDLRQGKDIAKGNNQAGVLLTKAQKAIRGLTEKQYAEYEKYIYDNYIYAQQQELGIAKNAPELPKDIDSILSYENLQKLSRKTQEYKSNGIKEPFVIASQIPLLFGTVGSAE